MYHLTAIAKKLRRALALRRDALRLATNVRAEVRSERGEKDSRKVTANQNKKRVRIWLLKLNYKRRKIN